MIKRFSKLSALRSLFLPFVLYLAFALIIGYIFWPYFYYIKNETIILIGIIAIWRYSWQLIHHCRAMIFRLYYFPKIRRKAESLPQDKKYPKNIFFIIPSYNEKPWISQETFYSIFSEISDIPSNATIIASTGSDKDDVTISSLYDAHPVKDKIKLIFQRQTHGKRIALGHALRCASREYYGLEDDPNSVVILMDGDSSLEPGTLKKTLPFFSLVPKLGALTTNEIAYIDTTSRWYKVWFNLKFGVRHILFQSHSLSKKVLTLTGRFSVLRASIVVNEDFIRKVEHDVITHWRHGKFKFLMGDDKSTWYHLISNGWEMLYVPDALCYSLESRNSSFIDLSLSLPHRWYGNTLRTSDRALALGWKKTGLFIWICLLDQRISMWTSLVGISGAVILAIFKSFIYLPIYLSWALMVRVLQITIITLHGYPVSIRTIPLMLYNQWMGAIIKIHASFNLSNQKWYKGNEHHQKVTNCVMIKNPLVKWIPTYCMILYFVVFLGAILVMEDVLKIPPIRFFTMKVQAAQEKTIDYTKIGLIPNDGKDDSQAINSLIQQHDGKKLLAITLPEGQLDILTPIILNKDNIILKGAGQGKTVLHTQLKKDDIAALQVIGAKIGRIGTLTEDVSSAQTILSVDTKKPVKRGEIFLLKESNNDNFFDLIGSKLWRKKYPEIRQTMVMVNRDPKGNRIYLSRALGIDLGFKDASIYSVGVVRNVALKDFSIRSIVKGHSINEVRGKYENLFPTLLVDSIVFKWALDSGLENIEILDSGRHPLVFENCLRCYGKQLTINGAWNKGKGGNGYLRIARSHYCRLTDLRVDDIRHITIQWSSSHNTLQNIKSGVDINFHGGGEHNNSVKNANFIIPEYHPFKPVNITGNNAHWAPPSGTGNYINGKLLHP